MMSEDRRDQDDHTQSPSSFSAVAKPFVLLFAFDSPTLAAAGRTERSEGRVNPLQTWGGSSVVLLTRKTC